MRRRSLRGTVRGRRDRIKAVGDRRCHEDVSRSLQRVGGGVRGGRVGGTTGGRLKRLRGGGRPGVAWRVAGTLDVEAAKGGLGEVSVLRVGD